MMKTKMQDSGKANQGKAAISGSERVTKAAQREATTARLLEVARASFARDGYAATATEDLVRAAGVTRGALYHHFENKEGLFRAVLGQVHAEVGEKVAAAADAATDDWDALLAGCRAFLAAANDAGVQRIMLIDGPSVLGWSEWRRMDTEHSLKLLQEHLALLVERGILRSTPIPALAHLLSGAMNELALWVAQREETGTALSEAAEVLNHTLDGLRNADRANSPAG